MSSAPGITAMKLTIALVFIFCASLSSGCSPNVKDTLQIYQSMYKNVPCIQCQPFEVATAVNFNCSNYAESFEDGTCGISSTVYSQSAKHCAVATLTCFPIGLGNVAAWGISAGSVADATDAEITLISNQKKLLVDLPLHCNNETTWQLGRLVGSATFLATTTPSLLGELVADEGSPQFVIPDFFSGGNFTLHCISSRPSYETEDAGGISATTVTLSIPETDGEKTVVAATETKAPASGTPSPATGVVVVVDGNNVVDISKSVNSTTDEPAASNDTITFQTGNTV